MLKNPNFQELNFPEKINYWQYDIYFGGKAYSLRHAANYRCNDCPSKLKIWKARPGSQDFPINLQKRLFLHYRRISPIQSVSEIELLLPKAESMNTVSQPSSERSDGE